MKSFGWICLNTIQLEVKEVIKKKSKLKFEECKVWVCHWYLNLRQKIKLKKFKSEFEIEEIKMDEFKCEGEIWKLKKLWVQKAEVDKSGNDELEYSENQNCWYLKVET